NTSTSAHGATGAWVRKRGRSSLAVASCSRTAEETTSSWRGSGVPATYVSARQPATTYRPSVERTGRASRTPSTNSVSRTRADQAARAWSATIESTTSPQRQPPSQLAPTEGGSPPENPTAEGPCSGGASTLTAFSLVGRRCASARRAEEPDKP